MKKNHLKKIHALLILTICLVGMALSPLFLSASSANEDAKKTNYFFKIGTIAQSMFSGTYRFNNQNFDGASVITYQILSGNDVVSLDPQLRVTKLKPGIAKIKFSGSETSQYRAFSKIVHVIISGVAITANQNTHYGIDNNTNTAIPVKYCNLYEPEFFNLKVYGVTNFSELELIPANNEDIKVTILERDSINNQVKLKVVPYKKKTTQISVIENGQTLGNIKVLTTSKKVLPISYQYIKYPGEIDHRIMNASFAGVTGQIHDIYALANIDLQFTNQGVIEHEWDLNGDGDSYDYHRTEIYSPTSKIPNKTSFFSNLFVIRANKNDQDRNHLTVGGTSRGFGDLDPLPTIVPRFGIVRTSLPRGFNSLAHTLAHELGHNLSLRHYTIHETWHSIRGIATINETQNLMKPGTANTNLFQFQVAGMHSLIERRFLLAEFDKRTTPSIPSLGSTLSISPTDTLHLATTSNSGVKVNYQIISGHDFINLIDDSIVVVKKAGQATIRAHIYATGQYLAYTKDITISVDFCTPTSKIAHSATRFKALNFSNLRYQSKRNYPGAYVNKKDTEVTLVGGNTYVASMFIGRPRMQTSIWVDFNDDYMFSDNERILSDFVSTGKHSQSNSIIVPDGVTLGKHVMRVRTMWRNKNTEVPACGQVTRGQTIDFMANIKSKRKSDLGISDIKVTFDIFDSGNDTIKFQIENYGEVEYNSFSAKYSIDNGLYVSKTFSEKISPGESKYVYFITDLNVDDLSTDIDNNGISLGGNNSIINIKGSINIKDDFFANNHISRRLVFDAPSLKVTVYPNPNEGDEPFKVQFELPSSFFFTLSLTASIEVIDLTSMQQVYSIPELFISSSFLSQPTEITLDLPNSGIYLMVLRNKYTGKWIKSIRLIKN